MTNNFIEPQLTGHAVGLNPLVVLVALAFWGLRWGLVGMVLAVPLTVMLKIVCEKIEPHLLWPGPRSKNDAKYKDSVRP